MNRIVNDIFMNNFLKKGCVLLVFFLSCIVGFSQNNEKFFELFYNYSPFQDQGVPIKPKVENGVKEIISKGLCIDTNCCDKANLMNNQFVINNFHELIPFDTLIYNSKGLLCYSTATGKYEYSPDTIKYYERFSNGIYRLKTFIYKDSALQYIYDGNIKICFNYSKGYVRNTITFSQNDRRKDNYHLKINKNSINYFTKDGDNKIVYYYDVNGNLNLKKEFNAGVLMGTTTYLYNCIRSNKQNFTKCYKEVVVDCLNNSATEIEAKNKNFETKIFNYEIIANNVRLVKEIDYSAILTEKDFVYNKSGELNYVITRYFHGLDLLRIDIITYEYSYW